VEILFSVCTVNVKIRSTDLGPARNNSGIIFYLKISLLPIQSHTAFGSIGPVVINNNKVLPMDWGTPIRLGVEQS